MKKVKEEKNVEETKVEKVEVVKKTRGRKKLTPEEKELSKKYRLLKEFKKSLGIDDDIPVDVESDGTDDKQPIIDKIGDIIQGLKDLKKMIKKI